MSEEEARDAILDGPFKVELEVSVLITAAPDDYQVANVTFGMAKGNVPTRTAVEKAIREAHRTVAERFPDCEVELLSRRQFTNYLVTGAPEMRIAFGGPDEFELAQDITSTRTLLADDDEEF